MREMKHPRAPKTPTLLCAPYPVNDETNHDEIQYMKNCSISIHLGLLILATIAPTISLRSVEGQTTQKESAITLRPPSPLQMTMQRISIMAPHPAIA